MGTSNEQETIAKYKSHTHREHIYKVPDTYIGSVEKHVSSSWRVQGEHMCRADLECIPGIYKIVDEVIVNAWDQHIRYRDTKDKVTYIDITVDQASGIVSVENDGKGIDVLMHPEHNIHTVEMIFGKLLTSTNYTEGEERIVGGKNGYGAKLANIFSQWFEVETVDMRTMKKYVQRFENNMLTTNKPKITPTTKKMTDMTKVTFLPDFQRFEIAGWTDDMVAIFQRRAYELAACCDGCLRINFNKQPVPIKRFKNFCSMYFEPDDPVVVERCSNRWEVAVGVADDFQHVSFVNGIFTSKGGKHVDHVTQTICKRMIDIIAKKEKVTVKPNNVRDHLFLIVNCIIVNPSFDSQTKDYLTTPVAKFGSKCELSEKFYDGLAKSGIITRILDKYNFEESKKIKKTDGRKKSRIYGIPKLDDANEAGGKKSQDCTLILTEGDSAKAMAIAGLSVVGRDLYGVFPLRGKVINAREKITTKQGKEQVMKNTELVHMKQILGLEQDAKYTNTSKLRYGHIMIMTDQDYDGSHIKGLIINWLDTFWPDLLKIEGFVQCMQTPIVKTFHKTNENLFYSLQKYEEWKTTTRDKKNWKIKYYKGLGTSTTQEAKEYFQNMVRQIYIWDCTSNNAIDLAFNRDRSHDRKLWLKNHNEDAFLDEVTNVPYADFVNKELVHFSNYDLQRSVPHVMDGLKPSQRKILFSCFKRKLKSEIRVAQLAGYVSEHSGYHHGEESLNKAIISMAQNYVGSNNIHLLEPNGQFGTRIMGGKDAGSPRYLHTQLSGVTSHIFHPADEAILNYLDDDGLGVEPDYYAPIIPFVLCNGCQGIGTGYSTSIPSYNPKAIVEYVRAKINQTTPPRLIPHYNGFTGDIYVDDDGNITTKGKYEVLNYKTILIKELPIGTWFDSYKIFIDEIVAEINSTSTKKNGTKPKPEFRGVKNYKSQSTESSPHFEIEVDPTILGTWLQQASKEKRAGAFIDNIEKRFRLSSKISTTNMHLYTVHGCVKKYNDYHEIIDDHYASRHEKYVERKASLLDKLQKDLKIYENKVRFIKYIIDDTLDIRKYTKTTLSQWLAEKTFDTDDDGSFAYLTQMPLSQMTQDMVIQLEDACQKKRDEHSHISALSVATMWLADLDELEKHVITHMATSKSTSTITTKKNARLKKK